MLAAFVIQLLITHVVATDPATEDVVAKLKEFTNQFQKSVRACLLTDLFMKFKVKYQLLDKTINDASALITEVKKVDRTVVDGDLTRLFTYYQQQEVYINQMKARNRLVFYINLNPMASCLDRSDLLEVFFSTHTGVKDHVTNFEAFKSYMHGIDHRMDLRIIEMLYPHVHEYKKHLDRLPSRTTLQTGAPGKTFAQLKVIMDPFITEYQMGQKDVSQLRTFRRLLYGIDFVATDTETRALHPYVKNYKLVEYRKDKREKLHTKIIGLPASLNPDKSHEIKFEAWHLFAAYNLFDSDITDLERFKTIIAEKDISISRADIMLTRLHPHAVHYMKYLYKIEVRKMMLNLIRNPLDQSILEISNVMDAFFAAYNIFDYTFTDGATLKPHMFAQDGVTTLEEATEFYALYERYKRHIDLENTKDLLLTMLLKRPRENIFFFEEYVESFLTKYDFLQYGISRLTNFLKYMRLKNPMVTEKEAENLHPIVMKYLDYKGKKSAYDRLLACIENTNPVKPDMKDLSEKAMRVLGLTNNHLSNVDDFKTVVGGIYMVPDEEKMKKVFDHLAEYERLKSQKAQVREIRPGDITVDGNIVPPTSGSELSWYNFFKFFNVIPHIVKGVSRRDKLTPSKQWFDDFYQRHTGIHYYVIDPLLAYGVSSAPVPVTPASVVTPPRASPTPP